jgi:alkylation response protein AidB-like acyl-CoA dehydrogenase
MYDSQASDSLTIRFEGTVIMLNFTPTEEQEEIRELAHSLAKEQLRPHERAVDRAASVPSHLLQTLTQTGLATPFPEEFGGSGPIEAMTYALIAEELGFGDSAVAMHLLGSLMGPITVMLAGNAQQQREYLPPFSDLANGHTRFGSLAFAERTGGYSLNDINATARIQDKNYLVNGTKRDVLHGSESSPRVVLVRLEGTAGMAGICALLVPAETDGLQIIPDTHKLGFAAAPSAAYTFNEALVATNALLGEPGNAGVLRAIALYQILRAGVACGIARAGLEYASEYASQRIAFGRPIVSYQGIAFLFSEMSMKLDAARLYLWRAATSWDKAVELATLVKEAEAAQYQAIKIAKSATIDTIQILGGAGFIQDHPAEMWMRNAAAME